MIGQSRWPPESPTSSTNRSCSRSLLIKRHKQAPYLCPPRAPNRHQGRETGPSTLSSVSLLTFVTARRGGSTVTALMVLRRDTTTDAAHYWFAANRQTLDNLQTTAAFVKRILQKVGEAPVDPDNQHVVRKSLLHDILSFNRPRVLSYLGKLQSQVAECLNRCNLDKIEESK